jgi:hypothetical protein
MNIIRSGSFERLAQLLPEIERKGAVPLKIRLSSYP